MHNIEIWKVYRMGQHKHIYNSKEWKALRDDHLAKNPLCKYCNDFGRVVAASVVNHIEPHRGDKALAFDPANLESACETCHNVHSDAQDKGKTMAGCDADGMPIDPNHSWGS